MRKEIKPVEQATIHPDLLEVYTKNGWRYVGALNDKQLVVERPLDESKQTEEEEEEDLRKYFRDD